MTENFNSAAACAMLPASASASWKLHQGFQNGSESPIHTTPQVWDPLKGELEQAPTPTGDPKKSDLLMA